METVTTRHVDRVREWRASLTTATLGALGFLTVSGFIIWFAPFGEFGQWSVVVHTVIGVVALAPAVWYAVRHWWVYRSQPLTWITLLGYLGLVTAAVCLVSGVVLTWQALAGTRIDYAWRAAHQWSTVALLVSGLPHILGIVVRLARAQAAETTGPVIVAARHAAWVTATATALGLVVTVGAVVAYRQPAQITEFPKDYDLWEPKNPLYAKNRPFAPSLARTKDSRPIDSTLLAGSEGCGTAGCHSEILEEWQPSAHRYSAMDKAFQAIQLTMAKQNGPTSTRYCGGCHDPISLFSGTKNISADERELTALHGYQEGVSCLSCHSIKETDIRGNAHYTMEPPPRYVGELEFDRNQATTWRLVRDFLIRSYPRQHVAGLSKVMFKKPEYCAACHKQFVDEEVNKVGWVQLQNQFDNWRNSRWARERQDPQKTIECRECHMPLVPSTDPAAGDPVDYNRTTSDRKHRSHRFIGGNQLMPAMLGLEGHQVQTELTHQWLRGDFAIPEIEHKWRKPGVPAVSLQLVTAPSVRAGDPVAMKCVITSNKVGHDFPTGPLDIIQSWVELIVRDKDGTVVFETGTVDDEGFIRPGTFLFKAEPVDQYGNLIDRHNLWEMVGVRNRRALFPGFSDTAEYTFKAPPSGPLTVNARLRYRKIDQFLLNFLRSVGFFAEFKDQKLTSPITDLHAQNATIEVLR